MFARQLAPQRWTLAVDVVVVVWIVAWLFVGVRVHDEVEGLRELSQTISQAGGAVEQTGQALGALNLPLVGDRIDDAAERAIKVGRDTRLSGRTARDSISDLSTLLGTAVALIPLSPILFLYLPLRLGRIRERRAMRRLIENFGDEPGLERLLAHRALQTMSYRRLEHEVGGPFWNDLADGRYGDLAAAERRRLNLDARGR